MLDLTESLGVAAGLILHADPVMLRTIWLSLVVSGSACAIASVVGLAAGGWLASKPFPGRRIVVAGLHTLLALPSVVVGLVVYLLLSRAGPLGAWGILFTPGAMVIAQTILVLPLLAALSRQLVADGLRQAGDPLRSMGATPMVAGILVLLHERWAVATIVLTAFGRALSEVGAVMIVGGNIEGVTRVMTTSIALETSKGDLPLALALGVVLLAIVATVNGMAILARRLQRGESSWGEP
ncbi:MAG TPA: ABC transporter permease [Burkholderiaceae bacterium]|nr:ABC transporter permease [Burkholderiaceae bacterium]